MNQCKFETTQSADKQVPSPWLNSKVAADYMSCSPNTLKTWRSKGGGPRYHIINNKAVRYHVSDLDAFIRGELV